MEAKLAICGQLSRPNPGAAAVVTRAMDRRARLVAMTNPTTHGSALRIRPWWVKAAYVVAGAALVYLVAGIPLGPGSGGILRSGLAFILVVFGARIFRGPDEDDLPRPWWRMTAGVSGGVLLGSLFALVTFLSASGWVGLTLTTLAHRDVVDLPALLVNTVLAAILAALYFRSSRRLVLARRAEALSAAQRGR
jgi:hypothetical protein